MDCKPACGTQGRSLSLFRKRLRKFRTIKRGYYSFLIIVAAYAISFFLPLLVNNEALAVGYHGHWYFPSGEILPGVRVRPASDRRAGLSRAGRDASPARARETGCFCPLIPTAPPNPCWTFPAALPIQPSRQHIFGTDDRGRDIFARLAYGFNVSLSFALLVLTVSLCIGVTAGALLGYFGGKLDILGVRLIEIWSSLPFLYTIIIVSSIVVPIYLPGRNLVLQPSFWLLIFILTAFDWMGITYYVRGEFYREKSKDYVGAAIAMGASDRVHHLQAHFAQRAHAHRFLRAIHGGGQYQARSLRWTFSALDFPRPRPVGAN